jgi:hypothetical protein
MGAANPTGAADLVASIAREKGLRGLTVAAVTGDDVLHLVENRALPLLERTGSLQDLAGSVVSANAYLGCEPIVEALALGADVVITGRVADPSLYLAALVHEFGWAVDDWDLIGKGICVGHLLECAGHVTGGYFADPGYEDVAGLADLGFPIAEVGSDGSTVITKVEGTGGEVSVRTCTEQLLYEIHDPACYPSADAVADFSRVRLEQVGPDRVAVHGATARARPDALKVSVGYIDGWVGEGEISYAGPNALARGRLALDIVQDRLVRLGVQTSEVRAEVIGVDAVHRGVARTSTPAAEPPEIRVRIAARTPDMRQARRVGHEVISLWLNGPAGGGGATGTTHEVIAIASVFVPREQVTATVALQEA